MCFLWCRNWILACLYWIRQLVSSLSRPWPGFDSGTVSFYDGRTDTDTDVLRILSSHPCQHHSTNTLYAILILFFQKDMRANLLIFQQRTAVLDMREQWTEECFHILPGFARLKTLYLVLFATVVSEVCVCGGGGGINLTWIPFHPLNRSGIVTELICEFKRPWSLVGRSHGTGLNKLPHCSSTIISLNES
jgi:hypothetical protein